MIKYLKRAKTRVLLFLMLNFYLIGTVSYCDETMDQKVIIARVQGGDGSAILELGKIKKPSTETLNYLKSLSKEDNKAFGSSAVYARMVLAKLGDKECFSEVQKELLHGNPYEQTNAFEKLTYINGKNAIVLVAKFLNQEGQPMEKGPKDKVFFPPYSKLAVFGLSKMVEDPISKPNTIDDITQEDVNKWRQWWNENKTQYEQ